MLNALTVMEAFEQYLTVANPQGILKDAASLLARGELNKSTLLDLCRRYGVELSDMKDKWLDLILFYIQYTLSDHQLTLPEKLATEQLKELFQVQEGDFY